MSLETQAKAELEIRKRGGEYEQAEVWQPLPGPQTEAYYCEADELFYGGSAGGGKSDLLLGLAATAHTQSVIFRRQYENLKEIEERARDIIGEGGRYNGQRKMWKLDNGKRIDFGAVKDEKDKFKWRGRPHDLKGFDELPEFTKSQYEFLTGWTRTTIPDQRVRIVCAGNPPTQDEGLWIIDRFGPWLDPNHPDPAEPGELRWFAIVDGDEVVRKDGKEFKHNDEIIYPKSRTFIPARLEDNPYLEKTGYRKTLQGLPEPLRSQLLYGDFEIGTDDNAWQVIPTEWVNAAIERGRQQKKPNVGLSQVGNDVAYTGGDKTTFALRYDNWLDPIVEKTKEDTNQTAHHLKQMLLHKKGAVGVIDTTGGYGAGVWDKVKHEENMQVTPFNFSGKAKRNDQPITDRTGRLTFYNNRAWLWWNMRDVLDPASENDICLPDDPELKADLTSARWQPRPGGVIIEKKTEIQERLGRSPDKGDACCLAFLPIFPAELPKQQPEQKSKFLADKVRPGQSKFKDRF